MPYLNDSVLDAALAKIVADTDKLYLCSQEPTTLTQAETTYKLGTKSSPAFGAATDATSPIGRKRATLAVSDGTIETSGTATHWALVDSGTALIATGALVSSVVLTAGNTLIVDPIEIKIPDAI